MRTVTRVVLVAALAALTLAGCVRYEANLTLGDDNTASGEVVLAVSTAAKDRLGAASDAEAFEAVFGEVTFGDAFEMTPYADGDYVGERYAFESVPFDELGTFGGLFTVSREGDTIVVAGLEAPGSDADADSLPDATDATLRIEFPGPVTQHNGALDGNTVTWDLMTQTEPIAAQANAPGDDGLKQALIGGLIAAASVTVLAAVIILIQRRRIANAREASSATEPTSSREDDL